MQGDVRQQISCQAWIDEVRRTKCMWVVVFVCVYMLYQQQQQQQQQQQLPTDRKEEKLTRNMCMVGVCSCDCVCFCVYLCVYLSMSVRGTCKNKWAFISSVLPDSPF